MGRRNTRRKANRTGSCGGLGCKRKDHGGLGSRASARSIVKKRPDPRKRQTNVRWRSIRREEDALTERDALSYLREVKERFKDKKQVYESFLRIMKDFKVGRYASGVKRNAVL